MTIRDSSDMLLNRIAVKFDRIVQAAVRAEVANDLETQIFGGYPKGNSPLTIDFDGLGDAQPQFACRPQRGHFAPTNARAERAEPTEMRRVRIRAENGLPGKDDRFFAQDLMTDAASHLEKICHAHFVDKAAHVRVILRVLGGGGGHGMVERNRQSFGVL